MSRKMIEIDRKDYKPSIEEIATYIDNPLFENLVTHMDCNYQAIRTVEYSGCSMQPGWNVKFKKAGKSLGVVYPMRHTFMVLVVVGKKEKEAVEALLPQMSEKMQRLYAETQEGNGQRWLMMAVHEPDDFYQDTLELIRIRRTSK